MNKKIAFVSYDGEYPNLCSGVLILKIDGIEYKFGHHYMNHHYIPSEKRWGFTDEPQEKPNYPGFWISGGNILCNEDYDYDIEYGPWKYNGDLDEYEEFTPEMIEEFMKLFNSNVQEGCCGGCI